MSLDFSEGSFYTEKDRLYFLPGTVRLPKLRYLRTGLFLGESRKKRFEPSQALAMALSPDTFASCICLSSDDVRTVKYLKGETIEVSDLKPAKEKGWPVSYTHLDVYKRQQYILHRKRKTACGKRRKSCGDFHKSQNRIPNPGSCRQGFF